MTTHKKSKKTKTKATKKMKGGSETQTINTVTSTTNKYPTYNLSLKIQDDPDNLKQPISEYSSEPIIDKDEIMKNIRQIVIDLQHKIFDKVESNYEYFTIMNYQIFIDEMFSRILSKSNSNNKLQVGGENCNGELLLSESGPLKEDFRLLSMLKNFVEIKHDFNKKQDGKNYTLNYEREILDASRIIMRYFSDKNKTGINYNFFDSTLNTYDSGQESIREQLYMKEVINFMDLTTQCKVLNRLNLTKYITDSKVYGKNYVEKKIVEGKQNYIFQYTDKDKEKIKLLYLSTVDNNPVEKIFSEDQVKFAFTDNSISDSVLYPHVYNSDTTRQTIENLDDNNKLSDFSSILSEGNINTIPSFIDPANISVNVFSNLKLISDDNDVTNLIRKRVQELQSLEDPYSLPFLKLLIKSLNDFFGYYGSSLKINDKELNSIISINDFEKECEKYITTGIKDPKWNEGYLNDIKSKYPIKLGINEQKGYVFFNVLNFKNSQIKLIVQGTTIRTISSFLNNTSIFPVDISEINENNIETVEHKITHGTYPKDFSILYEFSKAIYDNIADKPRGEMLDKLTNNRLQKNLQLLMIIIVSLKAFGDACQVNYSRRVNDYLKNTIKFPLGVGIRTTDKNVFAESILHNNPVWFTNSSIKPHFTWIKNLFGEESIDFESHKVFLTNCDKGDVKLYYSEIIKNLNRFNNYNKGGLDLSTPEIQQQQQRKGAIDFESDDDSDDEYDNNIPTSNPISNPTSNSTIIPEDKDINLMSKETLSFLSTLIKDTFKSKLRNPESNILIVPDVINEENVKNFLLEANIYTSIMNDYMKNVEYKQTNDQTQLEDLINTCNSDAIKIAKQINKIAYNSGGFESERTSLLKNINLIESPQETKKIKQIYDNLRSWVNINLNNECNEKMSQVVQKYNANVESFKASIVEEFKEKVKQVERSRRTGTSERTFKETSVSSIILRQWSISNSTNINNFKKYIVKRLSNLISIMLKTKEKEETKENIKKFNDDIDNSLKTFFNIDYNLSEKIEIVHKNLQDLKQYERMMDEDVNNDIIKEINNYTEINNDILNLLKNDFSKTKAEIKKMKTNVDAKTIKTINDFIDNFYYIKPDYANARDKVVFNEIVNKFKVTQVYEKKPNEVIFSSPEEVQELIREKKGRIVFLNTNTENNNDVSNSFESSEKESSEKESYDRRYVPGSPRKTLREGSDQPEMSNKRKKESDEKESDINQNIGVAIDFEDLQTITSKDLQEKLKKTLEKQGIKESNIQERRVLTRSAEPREVRYQNKLSGVSGGKRGKTRNYKKKSLKKRRKKKNKTKKKKKRNYRKSK